MRIVWLGVGLFVAAAALGACSKSDATGPTTTNTGVNGNWTFQELLSNAGIGLTCADSATITLTQSGQTFTGTYAQTGVCSQGGQQGANDGNGNVTNGVIKGDSIAFNEDNCLYTGTTTGNPATRMGGNVDCPDTSTGQLIDITGNWSMSR